MKEQYVYYRDADILMQIKIRKDFFPKISRMNFIFRNNVHDKQAL